MVIVIERMMIRNAGRMEEEMNNVAEWIRSNRVKAVEVNDLPVESLASDV
jgi:hypothetical protein